MDEWVKRGVIIRAYIAYKMWERDGEFPEELQDAMLDMAIPVDEYTEGRICLTIQ